MDITDLKLHILTTDELNQKYRASRNKIYEATRLALVTTYFTACNCIVATPNRDDQDADLLLTLPNNKTLRCQLKSRPTVNEKYMGKSIYMMFPLSKKDSRYVIIDHDVLQKLMFGKWNYHNKGTRNYSSNSISNRNLQDIINYSVVGPFDPKSVVNVDYL